MAAAVALTFLFFLAQTLDAQPLFVERQRVAVPEGSVRFIKGVRGERIVIIEGDRVGLQTQEGSPFVVAGGYGWGLDGFDGPSDIASDLLSIYIADKNNHRVVRLDRSLRPVSYLSTRDSSDRSVSFGYPLGIALNERGDVAIIDGESNEIVVFDSRGSFVRRFGRDARSGRALSGPIDIVHDGAHHWFVLDRAGILKYDSFGNVIGHTEVVLNGSARLTADKERVFVARGDQLSVFSGDLSRYVTIATTTIRLDGSQNRILDIDTAEKTLEVLYDDLIVVYIVEGLSW
jgi:hypothetical protein